MDKLTEERRQAATEISTALEGYGVPTSEEERVAPEAAMPSTPSTLEVLTLTPVQDRETPKEATLIEMVIEVVSHLKAASAERDELKAELAEVAAVREEEARAFTTQAEEINALGEEMGELKNELAASHDVVTGLEEETRLLQIELARATEEISKAGAKAAEDVAKAKAENERLFAQVDTMRDELMSAMAQVAASQVAQQAEKDRQGGAGHKLEKLEVEHDVLLSETKKCRTMLQEALESLSVVQTEKSSLSEQVAALINQQKKKRTEFETVSATLTETLESLNIVTGEKMTLAEKIQWLITKYETMKSELSDASGRVTEALKVTGEVVDKNAGVVSLIGTLVRHFNSLRDDGSGANAEVKRVKSALAQALMSVGQLKDKKDLVEFENAALSVQVNTVVTVFKESEEELSRIRASLKDALNAIGNLNRTKADLQGKNCKLSEQVRDMVEDVRQLAAQRSDASDELKRLECNVNVLQEDKSKLSQRVARMVQRHTDDEIQLRSTKQDLQHQINRWMQTVKDMEAERAKTKDNLNRALSSVNGLTGDRKKLSCDKRKLSEIVHDLVHQYETTQQELQSAIIDRQHAQASELETTKRAQRLAGEWARERARLVETALQTIFPRPRGPNASPVANGMQASELLAISAHSPPASRAPIAAMMHPPQLIDATNPQDLLVVNRKADLAALDPSAQSLVGLRAGPGTSRNERSRRAKSHELSVTGVSNTDISSHSLVRALVSPRTLRPPKLLVSHQCDTRASPPSMRHPGVSPYALAPSLPPQPPPSPATSPSSRRPPLPPVPAWQGSVITADP